ncbi:MAG: DUF2203 domain-containing protein [Thermogutta sp.]|nr:DUF2203 domain-containing protein [Thermogutta sp.]
MNREDSVTDEGAWFSVGEANAVLVEVRPIVERMTALAEDVCLRKERLVELNRGARERHPLYRGEVAAMERSVEEDMLRLQEYVREIVGLGAEVKNIREGVLDFPARLEGRRIWLCWRLGEPEILFWHERDAGFAGRRSVSELPECS